MTTTTAHAKPTTSNGNGKQPRRRNGAARLVWATRGAAHAVIAPPPGPEPAVSIMTITPQVAAEMLAGNAGNRKRRQGTTERYARQMLAGSWWLDGTSIVFCDDPNHEPWGRLMQGQHRLTGCVSANEAFEALVLVHAPGGGYDTMDSGLRRGLGDVLSGHGYPSDSGFSSAARLLCKWDSAVPMSESTEVSPSEVVDWLDCHDGVEECVRLARTLQYSDVKGWTGSVMAALYYPLSQYDEALCHRWHAALREGLGLSRYDPARVLRTLVANSHVDKSKRPRQHVKLAVAIKAFNTWLAGEETRALSFRVTGPAPEDFPVLIDARGKAIKIKVKRRSRRPRAVPAGAPVKSAMDKAVFGASGP